jgi:hypothetical protein
MSWPFGGHPSLGRYLYWAVNEAGCTTEHYVMTAPDGRPFSLIEIKSPTGKMLIIPNGDPNERLVPTTIARWDRRLGVQSKFSSVEDTTH